MLTEDKTGESPVSSSDCSGMAGSVMVSHNAGEHSRPTCSFASLPSCISKSNGTNTSSSEEQQSEIGRLEGVRKSIKDRGISEEGFEILSSS